MVDQIFIGRRKTAVARVILKNGNGKISVNGRDLTVAFPLSTSQDDILLPF